MRSGSIGIFHAIPRCIFHKIMAHMSRALIDKACKIFLEVLEESTKSMRELLIVCYTYYV